MPNKERLYVPDKESCCFIMSDVHKETYGAIQKPNHKSFKTKYGKEILFTSVTNAQEIKEQFGEYTNHLELGTMRRRADELDCIGYINEAGTMLCMEAVGDWKFSLAILIVVEKYMI